MLYEILNLNPQENYPGLRIETDAEATYIYLDNVEDVPEFKDEEHPDNEVNVHYRIDLSTLDHTIPLHIVICYDICFAKVKYTLFDSSSEAFPLMDVEVGDDVEAWPEDGLDSSLKLENISGGIFKGNKIVGLLRRFRMLNCFFRNLEM